MLNNHPLDSGWAFARWVDMTAAVMRVEGAQFYATADMHRAYDRGGLTAAMERCITGIEASISAIDKAKPGTPYCASMCRVMDGWVRMLAALVDLGGAK